MTKKSDNPRERISDLKNQIALWEVEINNTSAHIGLAAEEQNRLILQIITTEDLLRDSEWELKFNRSYEVRLETTVNTLSQDTASVRMNKIAELMCDWHTRFEIEDGISLEFESNNGDMQMDSMDSKKYSDNESYITPPAPAEPVGKDNSFTLRFSESRLVMPFITKNKMTIKADTLSDKLRELRRSANQLENISHQLGLKT